MTTQAELFDRAAEWERRMEAEDDRVKKQVLKQIRDLWIALANNSANMRAEILAEEVEKLEAAGKSMLPE